MCGIVPVYHLSHLTRLVPHPQLQVFILTSLRTFKNNKELIMQGQSMNIILIIYHIFCQKLTLNHQFIHSMHENYDNYDHDINFLFSMLSYNWNNFMISSQLSAGKIIVSAVPTNIRNLVVVSQDLEHIEKAFQGQIIETTLEVLIGLEKKQLRNITKFYNYLCECFNYLEKMRISQTQIPKNQQRIIVSRQWSHEQSNKTKKQRLIIKVLLQNDLGKEVKQEQLLQNTYVIKLKEIYLPVNSLLLKCNNIILSQLDYHKQSEKRFEEKISVIYKKIEDKMASEFAAIKRQMNEFFESFINKANLDHQQVKKDKKGKKSSNRNANENVKVQGSDDDTVLSKKKRKQGLSEYQDDSKAKAQDIQVIKYEDDQQSKRLKRLEQIQPKQQIIPLTIQFDKQNPAYYFFAISNKSVTKIGGFDYPIMMLKQTIPFQGTYGAIIKYVIQRKTKRCCCLQIGIIDERNKSLLHSSVCDNYIKFKFNSTTVFTKVNHKEAKKKYSKTRVLKPGESVQLRINLNLGIVSWNFCYGEVVRVEIPQQLRKMKLQAFVGIFTTGDTIEFLDYPQK